VQSDLASPWDCPNLSTAIDAIAHLAHVNTPSYLDRELASDAASNRVPTLDLSGNPLDRDQGPQRVYAESGGAVCGWRWIPRLQEVVRQRFVEASTEMTRFRQGILGLDSQTALAHKQGALVASEGWRR
jgi:hypothetical protein